MLFYKQNLRFSIIWRVLVVWKLRDTCRNHSALASCQNCFMVSSYDPPPAGEIVDGTMNTENYWFQLLEWRLPENSSIRLRKNMYRKTYKHTYRNPNKSIRSLQNIWSWTTTKAHDLRIRVPWGFRHAESESEVKSSKPFTQRPNLGTTILGVTNIHDNL